MPQSHRKTTTHRDRFVTEEKPYYEAQLPDKKEKFFFEGLIFRQTWTSFQHTYISKSAPGQKREMR